MFIKSAISLTLNFSTPWKGFSEELLIAEQAYKTCLFQAK